MKEDSLVLSSSINVTYSLVDVVRKESRGRGVKEIKHLCQCPSNVTQVSFDDDKISFNNMLCFSISNVPTAMREAKSLLNVCCALKILRDIPSTL